MKRNMKTKIILSLLLAGLHLGALPSKQKTTVADDIGFIEKFALANDRAEVLKELIPGTEDYYYFHCLHYQNTEQFEKVDEMLDKWISRYDYQHRAGQGLNQRSREIVNRQMLLTYSTNPKRTLSYLERYLKLNFNHQRESMDGPSLPSVLDPVLVARKTLTERALARHTGIRGFESSALSWLLDEKLSNSDQYNAHGNFSLFMLTDDYVSRGHFL